MYASRTTQVVVGVFGLLGIAALAILALDLGKIQMFPPPTYTLFADFDDVSGLKPSDSVAIAGVKIGKILSISLNGNRAHVTLQVRDGVEIDSEAIASIETSGILGDKYVSIDLGAGNDLPSGGTIVHTQSSFVLEKAIGQLINNAGGGNNNSSGNDNSKNNAKPDSQSNATKNNPSHQEPKK